MKSLYKITADAIFLIHCILVFIVLFGWAIPSIWTIYISLLVITLLSDLFFGYCIISKWEFDLRKKIDPQTNYRYTWSTYYSHRFTDRHISEVFFERAALFFLVASLGLNIYFHYFFTI